MEAYELRQITEAFRQLATRAANDPTTAHQLRDALAESGLLGVFGDAPTLDVVDLLDAGGEAALRARLRELALADLRAIVKERGYDPNKETTRWRSLAKLIDYIVAHAQKDLERMDQAQPATLSAASWML